MRVKRLEIQGFKSFKDKTVIQFDHGITGIVGPNGCGKSNIVDAFFWVMGEQSYKHMRGSSSDDLIFNGSSKFSPLGMAEATLVLETDFTGEEPSADAAGPDAPAGASTQNIPAHLRSKEVSVTRRLYRSGEGEYFINGVTARLKDIHELFMDTGVGAKGYSVIEQGQIGKIVNAKPEDRRLLIEEAAGIAKYKARKKESLRKMEATQSNLSRLNDVIQEIERSLNSLDRQAQKARQFKKYKDELIDKEMTWGRRKTVVLRQRLEQLKAGRDALEQELVGLKAELQVTENALEIDRIAQTTDGKAVEELSAQISAFSEELAREQSALELSRRRREDLSLQTETLERERSEVEAALQQERSTLEAQAVESSGSDESFSRIAEMARQAEAKASEIRENANDARSRLDQSRRELVEGVTRASEMSARAASLLSRAESARATAEKLCAQITEQQARREALATEASQIEATLLAARDQKSALVEARTENRRRLQEAESELQIAQTKRDTLHAQATQARSRLDSLEELAHAFEGYGEGAKAALEWSRSQGASHLQPLGDLIQVQDGFEQALQGWLEGRIEEIVADDLTTATSVVDYLKDHPTGRVAIRIGEPAPHSRSVHLDEIKFRLQSWGIQVLGVLAEKTQTRETLARMISNVLVVDTLTPALQADRGLAALEGWSLVTMDGFALDSNTGTIRGGTSGQESAGTQILRRQRAIAQLSEEAAKAAAELAECEAARDALQASLDELEERAARDSQAIQDLEIQIAAQERDLHQINRSLREADQALARIQAESEAAATEAQCAAAERESTEAQVASIVAERAGFEARIASEEAELAQIEESLRSEEARLQSIRVEEAQLRERASSLRRELETGRARVADRERRIEEIRRTLERTRREQEEFASGETSLSERIERATLDIARIREEHSTARDRLEQGNARITAALSRIKELHQSGDAKSAETNQMALELEKVSSDLSHLVQNLEEKYGPGCLERPTASGIQEEMDAPVVTQEMTAEEELALGEEVERLRERIRRLGDVNVGAIEEYEETKKRFDYLLGEKTDLERSIEHLQEAIEHINKTSEERFKRAFEAIQDRFERLFPIIFGGGSAKLSLVFPEGSTDILEAGVDILAQPPGKKVSNIGLLSGGEKALTAVSLIFAIFMVKPSPFCVLDEVDAPLDDANIGKFNALLREMSAKSQFILITHNKKTMELNDTLYGVTMEEPGVSKMVSIELH